jgi:type IV pilus assembly protein PilW
MTDRPMLKIMENREQGFTLIELLIAMAVALIIITALSGAFITQRRTYAVQEQVSEMIQNARAATDMITREIRMAGFAHTGYDTKFEFGTVTVQTSPMMQRTDQTASRFVGIPYDTTQLKIIADLNGDGDTSDVHEDISYRYDSTNKQIDRDTGGGGQPFAENIQSFVFQYRDGGGNTTTTVPDIREIELTITARTAEPDPDYAANNGYRTYTLTSYVTPPNLGF